MKKHLLIVISILSIGILTAQENDRMVVGPLFGLTKKPEKPANEKAIVHRPEYMVTFHMNGLNGAWEHPDTTFYTYNAEGYVLSETIKNSDYLGRNFYTLDANNRVIVCLYQSYFNGFWEDYFKDEYAFNQQGDQTQVVNSEYNSTTNSWDIQFGTQELYTYNAQNQLIDLKRKQYNTSTMTFENTTRSLNYMYDPTTGLLLSREYESWNSTSWIPQYRTEYILDANNIYTEIYSKRWDAATSSFQNYFMSNNLVWYNWNDGLFQPLYSLIHEWDEATNTYKDYEQLSYSYEANGGIIKTTEQSVNGAWVNEYRQSRLFDSHGNFTDSHDQQWNTVNNSWETTGEVMNDNTYNADNNLQQMVEIFFIQNPDILALRPILLHDYYNYQTFSNQVGMDELTTNTFTIYPNPSSATATIDCSKLNEACTIVITDLTGKQLQTIAVDANSALELNVTDYSKGMYSVQVVSNGKILGTERLIIQ